MACHILTRIKSDKATMPKTTKRVQFTPKAAETIDEDSILSKMFERLQKVKSKRKGILKRKKHKRYCTSVHSQKISPNRIVHAKRVLIAATVVDDQ